MSLPLPPAEPATVVQGPLLCAICANPVEPTEGFQYGITSLSKRHKLYAFVHSGSCDATWRKSLTNPDVPLGFGTAATPGSPRRGEAG